MDEKAFTYLMWDMRRDEIVSALIEEFNCTQEAADAAVTKAQNKMLGVQS